MEYNLAEPWKTLDDWQKKVLETKGNLVVRKGRQVGASTVISIKAGQHAVKYKNQNIIIVAKVERQALLLFEKVIAYLHANYKYMIAKGKDKPTKHKLTLINGSSILCVPTGESGYGIRGHTVDLLIIDEAAFINKEVYDAIVPMLAVTKGVIWMLSSPMGRDGYFYDCFKRDDFAKFHISYLDCPRRDDKFIKFCRETMTKAVFAQEIMGEFVDELHRLFSEDIIKRACTETRPVVRQEMFSYFLGVDVARMGEDESTFEILMRVGKELIHIENFVTTKTTTTQTADVIVDLNRRYNFKKIYIDTTGIGAGVFDILYDKAELRRKVVDIDNLKKNLDFEGKARKKTNKEMLYMNLLRLMEQKKIKLLKDGNVKASLRSIQYEYGEKGMKIYGNYSHIVEGLVRAAWCVKDKHLNIFIDYI